MCSQVQAGQSSVSEGDDRLVFRTVVAHFSYLQLICFPSPCSSADRPSLLFSKADGGEGRHSSNRCCAKEYLMIQNKGEGRFSLVVQFYPDI